MSFSTLFPNRNLSYVATVAVVFFLCTRVFRIRIGHILAMMLCVVIIYKLENEQSADDLDFNTTMEYQLQVIGEPSQFHNDTNLIDLFYNIVAWRDINANNYDQAIDAVNDILQLEQDTMNSTEYCVDNYDVARDKAKFALNLVHGFVYGIDHALLIDKLTKVLGRLQSLLETHLDQIRINCENQEQRKGKPNVYTRYIEDAKTFKAYDPDHMSTFDYY